MAETVLVTTHDLPLAGALRDGFRSGGYGVDLLTPGEDPARHEEPVLLVLTGGLDAEESHELVRQARLDMDLPVFAVGHGVPPELADVLTGLFTPPADPDEIVLVGRTAVERTRLQQITGIVGETDAMREVLERVVQIAPVDATVLITGESGTGKELVARGIHALSPRRHRPFIAVNVAALSDTLLESELFGHEKGAFTGALDMRKGFFELADQGTIFLDEIGEMPLQTQTKLLRVLEHQQFLRVGGEKPITVDVRILAATNQRLRELVTTGDFRKDLYYRLNVLNIQMPPLRGRREDIPRLVHAFIRDASRRHDRSFQGIADDAMEILVTYRWPGNVRELRNLIESMVVLAPGRVIQAEDIPDEVRRGEGAGALVPLGPSTRGGQGDTGLLRPQLEFLFRSMMDLRVDIEDLRREFEDFRIREARKPALLPPGGRVAVPVSGTTDAVLVGGPGGSVDAAPAGFVEVGSHEDEADRVVYEAGMTMEEVEEAAIRLVLDQVQGNRRKAAEALGIGERTLYRKIKKFGLDDS
ncbi:MAG: sigma-54-dependent Fis family transcriptional regulator [Gemmatimonadetes bacterium]|nr:sigma-54-dependent Fis family transcriptional regulator [Gemmatimonadota bacterium]